MKETLEWAISTNNLAVLILVGLVALAIFLWRQFGPHSVQAVKGHVKLLARLETYLDNTEKHFIKSEITDEKTLLELQFMRKAKAKTVKQLLVIEDNHDDFKLLKESCRDLFDELKIAPLWAENLKEAAESWAAVDFVLADLNLPGCDWRDVIGFLKRNGRKMAFYTGMAPDGLEQHLDLPVILKTDNLEILSRRVREFLES